MTRDEAILMLHASHSCRNVTLQKCHTAFLHTCHAELGVVLQRGIVLGYLHS